MGAGIALSRPGRARRRSSGTTRTSRASPNTPASRRHAEGGHEDRRDRAGRRGARGRRDREGAGRRAAKQRISPARPEPLGGFGGHMGKGMGRRRLPHGRGRLPRLDSGASSTQLAAGTSLADVREGQGQSRPTGLTQAIVKAETAKLDAAVSEAGSPPTGEADPRLARAADRHL